MKTTHSTALAARCAALNEVNAIALRLYPLYAAALAPFVGAQIEKAAGGFLVKVAKELDSIAESATRGNTHAWLTSGHGYSLTLHVKTHHTHARPEPGHPDYGHAHYAEAVVYLGELKGGTLVKLYPEPDAKHFRTDWTPEEVARLRKELESAESAFNAARAALEPFGKHDL